MKILKEISDFIIAWGAFILLFLIIAPINYIISFPKWLYLYCTGKTDEGFWYYMSWWKD
jgi:hypothetical protein